LQQLAEERVLDAEGLLNAGRWSGAFYLCGYAIECALKACIAKQTNLHDFPDKGVVNSSHTHDLTRLLDLAGLRLEFQRDTTPAANPTLGANWQAVRNWDESVRYELKTEPEARRLYQAVTDPADGVLTWIKKRW
jgi:HEPN domain-containing protein